MLYSHNPISHLILIIYVLVITFVASSFTLIFTMTHSVQYSYYNDFSYLSTTTAVQYINLPPSYSIEHLL